MATSFDIGVLIVSAVMILVVFVFLKGEGDALGPHVEFRP